MKNFKNALLIATGCIIWPVALFTEVAVTEAMEDFQQNCAFANNGDLICEYDGHTEYYTDNGNFTINH